MQQISEHYDEYDYNAELHEPELDDAPDLAERWAVKLGAFKRAPALSVREYVALLRREIGKLRRRESERGAREVAPTRLPDIEDILTPDQTAARLQIPKKTVIALCAQGRLAGAFKAGRRWRIPGRAVRLMAGEENKRCR